MNPNMRREIYLHTLQDRLCLTISECTTDVIVVEHAGARLAVHFDDPETAFVHIVMPFERPELPTEVLTRMANDVGARQKVAKVLLVDEVVLVSVEAIVAGAGQLPSVDALASLLIRLLDLIVAAGSRWCEEVALNGIAMAG